MVIVSEIFFSIFPLFLFSEISELTKDDICRRWNSHLLDRASVFQNQDPDLSIEINHFRRTHTWYLQFWSGKELQSVVFVAESALVELPGTCPRSIGLDVLDDD